MVDIKSQKKYSDAMVKSQELNDMSPVQWVTLYHISRPQGVL